jgi:hypothetical protein
MHKSLSELRKGQITRRLVTGVLLVGAFVWFSLNVWTAPVGLVWHSFHGNFTSFEGHRVPIPWDIWVGRSAKGSLMVTREASKYPILRSPAGTILIERGTGRAADMSKDYDRVARTNDPPPNGYRLQDIRQVLAAKGIGYCWEIVRVDSSYLSISCWFDKDTLAASYGGSPAYREKFYSVLATVSGAPSQSGK